MMRPLNGIFRDWYRGFADQRTMPVIRPPAGRLLPLRKEGHP